MHGENDEKPEEQDIVTNIEFEPVVPSIETIFHQHMVNFVNKLEFNVHKYESNETIRDDNYKGWFLFTMKDFVSFGTVCLSMFYM